MTLTKKIILTKHFEGMPKLSDFQIVEEELQQIQDGDIMTEALWISVDPYIRAYNTRSKVGETIIGYQLARVVESRNENFKRGDLVVGHFGWQTIRLYSPKSDAAGNGEDFRKPYVLPDFGPGLSPSLGLGVLGLTGMTAHFGFLEICRPEAGDVVVVTGAAGAVGSHVVQIAKLKGCFVIGFAGSDAKVKYLKEELKIDRAFNYKTCDVEQSLSIAAPQGIDCYFDNVGGDISSAILYRMKTFGRISCCGSISCYNAEAKNLPRARVIQPAVLMNQLKMEGFIVARWQNRFVEGISQNLAWLKEGSLTYREHVTEGFENLPEAFISMLNGENIGKAIVKV